MGGARGQGGGVSNFVFVSSVGADTASRAFYLRVKGEVEGALRKLGSIGSTSCVRGCCAGRVPATGDSQSGWRSPSVR